MENNIIGERLKAERTRLGLTQEAFAAIGSVKKLAQISYEQGKTFPDAAYLAALASVGVDVLYVVLGIQSATPLSAEEGELLGVYRMLDVRGRARLLGMLDGLTAPDQPTGGKIQNVLFKGDIGQQVAGDISAPQTINVGRKKK
jgi:transcriptional regulator with XRE-family HTH domain